MGRSKDLADLGALTSRLDTVGGASGSFGIGRNVIVNSAMMVSQRGTSFASVGNVYTLDRFSMYKQNTGSAFTVSQSSVTDLAGFANAFKVDCTTADTSIASNEQVHMAYKAEGQDLQRFQKGHATALGFTLSFYVKTNKTGVYTVKMFDRDNSRDVSGSYTVADANWNRYTINFPADTTGKFDDDNASSLEIFFHLVQGSDTTGGTLNTAWRANSDASAASGQVHFADSTSNNWEITGIQLETGSGAATDFEHEPYSVCLARCQRYCIDLTPTSGTTPYITGSAAAANSTVAVAHVSFPVQMRASPSLEFEAAGNYRVYNGGTLTVTSIGANGLSPVGGGINFSVSSGLSTAQAVGVYAANGTDRTLCVSEL